jgi:hypothetical protein
MFTFLAKYPRLISAAMLALAGATSAHAATGVSGPITADAAWTVAGSPYVLSGDVTIENGANLSVEPGVTIRMNTGANLRVVTGALSAQGTDVAPITLTSANDVAGSTAQPGDWGRLVFEDGTNDANTVLSHLRIRYGNGVVVTKASPRIDDTQITQHAGAAMTIDLESSPVGRGLSASGNAINGIAVPAGVIVGDVAWRLQGIPYVVAQGAVEIGLPPFSLMPEVLQLVAGSTGELTITLPEPAPAGGVSVSLSVGPNGVASVASPVVVPAGAHTATASVTANRVGEVSVTATNGSANAQSRIVVAAQPQLLLATSEDSVGVGRNKSITVSRNATNAAIVVDLASSDPGVLSVPASVTLAAGQASATFEATGVTPGAIWLRASAAGYTPHERVVRVHALKLIPNADTVVLALDSATMAFTLSDPAPAGGLVVAIDNRDSAALETPTSVTLPAGATAGTLAVRSLKNASSVVTLELSAPGYESATAEVSIHRLEPSLGVTPLPLGTTWTGRVQLSAPAPAGGVTVALSSLVPGIVDIVPAEVTIAAGQTQSTAPVTVRSLRVGRSVIRLQGVNLDKLRSLENVEVTLPAHLDFGTHPMRIGKGLVGRRLPDIVDADGQRANPGFSVFYRIESGDPARVGADAETHQWYHDSSSSTFFVQGIETTTVPVPVRLRNTQPANGIGDSPAVLVEVVPSQATFRNIGEGAVAVGARESFQVEWGDLGDLPPNGARLSVVDANPPGIVSLYDRHDATTPTTTLSGQTVWFEASAAGSFRVRVELDGGGAWTSPLQTVAAPGFVFEDEELSLGLGLTTQQISLSTHAGGAHAGLELPSDFAIVSDDPAKVEVVNVYRQWSGATVRLRALATTAPNAPVVVRATGGGRLAGEIAVTVVPAAVEFAYLDGVRAVARGKDEFGVRWAGKHAPTASQPVQVTVSLASGATPGVLPDPAVTQRGGAVPATLDIPADNNASFARLEVATPSGTGTYRLTASTSGGATVLSEAQYVAAALLKLGPTSYQTRYIYPIGKHTKGTARVALVDGPGGSEIPATVATTVHLVSRAPGWVSVPASVVIEAGQTAAAFDVTGVEVTDGDVLVDAYLDGVAAPMASLPVGVFPLDVMLEHTTVRTLADPPSPLGAQVGFYYPCSDEALAAKGEPPGGDRYCRADAPLVQAQVATLAVVGDDPPVVPGFLSAPGGPATSELRFPAGDIVGNGVFVGTPTRAGSYRVRVTLDGESSDSEPVEVGSPRLVPDSLALTIGTNTVDPDGVGLSLRIGNAYAGPPSTPIALQIACANPSVCSTPASVEMTGDDVYVPVTGIGAGTTTITVSAPGLPAIAPIAVTVVVPTLSIDVYPLDGRIDVGEAASIYAELVVPGRWGLKAVQPVVVEFANVDAPVASAPATLTIPAGENRSASGEVRGLSPGRTALIGTASGVAGAASRVIVVNGAGE